MIVTFFKSLGLSILMFMMTMSLIVTSPFFLFSDWIKNDKELGIFKSKKATYLNNMKQLLFEEWDF